MTTYDDIYDAFIQYAASRDDSSWWDLWILCQRRMGALVKTRAKKLKTPLSREDINSIIIDSTIIAIKKLKTAPDIDKNKISSIFWFSNLSAFRDYNRHMKKWQGLSTISNKL